MIVMKQKILLGFFAFIVLYACRKNSDSTKTADFNVSEVKDWLVKRQNKGNVQLNGNNHSLLNEKIDFKTNKGKKYSANIDWKNVTSYSKENYDFIEAHYVFDYKNNGHAYRYLIDHESNVEPFAISLLFRKNKINSQIDAFLVKYLIEKGDSTIEDYLISNSKKKKGISGYEMFYDVNGEYIDGYKFEGEKLAAKVTLLHSVPAIDSQKIVVQSNSVTHKSNLVAVGCIDLPVVSYSITCTTDASYNSICVYTPVYTYVQLCFGPITPDPSSPATGGSGSGTTTQPPPAPLTNIPCPGDVVKNPAIAKSSPTNINGGRFGQTRIDQETGNKKWHYGLDILAQPNTQLYAAYGGVVEIAVSDFPPTYYGKRSFGNLIIIRSTLPDGSVIRILYGHLNSVDPAIRLSGATVRVGQPIGLSGRTGNAQKGYSPHVHVQIDKGGQKVDPENYIATKFTASGASTGSPCY